MKIESETYLDFSDVLIRPKRSTLSSRSQIDLNQNFKFLYSSELWTGIPIIISNMDILQLSHYLDNLLEINSIQKNYFASLKK